MDSNSIKIEFKKDDELLNNLEFDIGQSNIEAIIESLKFAKDKSNEYLTSLVKEEQDKMLLERIKKIEGNRDSSDSDEGIQKQVEQIS